MAFTQEIVDFSGLPDPEISRKLAELNIPLTSQEALKIQNEMLGRAPSLSELILFSIQGSEHSSYKSSRSHLKQFTTTCLLYTSPSPRDATLSRMPSSA